MPNIKKEDVSRLKARPLDTGIFCLNLKRSPNRRRKMISQAELLGLELNFVDAIDGQNLTEETVVQYNSEWRRKLGHPLTINEIGCCLSHHKALKTFLESDFDFAIILEDDVTLSPNLLTVFEVCKQIPKWDVLHLGIQYDYKGRYSLRTVLDHYNIFVPCKVTRGAYGLAYSREGAKKTLKMNEMIHYAFDKQMALSYKNGIRHLAILPAPIKALDGESDIGDDRLNRKELNQRKNLYNKLISRFVRISHSFGIRLNQFDNYRFFKRQLKDYSPQP